MEHRHYPSSCQCAGILTEEGTGRVDELEAGWLRGKSVFRSSRVVELHARLNSWWLRHHEQYMCNPKTDWLPAWRGVLDIKVPFLGEKLFAYSQLREKRTVVSKSVVSSKLTTLQWKATYPKTFGHQNWLQWVKNRTQSWIKGRFGKSWGKGANKACHIKFWKN